MGLTALCGIVACAGANGGGDSVKERKVGVQCYTFKDNTFEETLQMLRPLGVKYLQVYGGQTVSADMPVKIGIGLSAQEAAKVRRMAESYGFEIASAGVFMNTDEASVKKVFELAQALGAKEVTFEAAGDALQIYAKFSKEYKIKATLHNHDNESSHNNYYDPYEVKAAIESAPDILAAPDTGNWGRAGIDATEALKVLGGKLYSIHLKDLDKFGTYKRGKSVAYGTGVLDMQEILAEMDKQGFDGIIYLESGESSKDPVPYVRQSIAYLQNYPLGFKREFPQRKIAVQAYTFRKFTIEEMADMLRKIGVKDVQFYPGQTVSKELDLKFSPKTPMDKWPQIKKALDACGLRAVSFGIISPKDAAEAQELVQFLSFFDIPQVGTESTGDGLTALKNAASKVGIEVAIHHHAKDSKSNRYYDPNVLLAVIKDVGYVKAMPDIGHWSRSGTQTVPSLRLLEGQIAAVHFKDHMVFDDLKSKCAAFGEGALNIPEILAELDRQGFDGYLIIENEHIADDPMPVITKCVRYLEARPVGKAYVKRPRNIALQTYSLNKYSFEEMLDICKSLGINTLEAYGRQGFGQPLTKGASVKFGYDMPKEYWPQAKKMLEERGMRIKILGTISPKDEADARTLFAFAKYIGADTVATEVPEERLQMMSDMSKETGIKVSLHNHAKDMNDRPYWNPVVVKALLEKYPYIKASPDNGHWARSGIDSVEGFAVLKGEIENIHFKDVSKFDDLQAECRVYAKGVLNMTDMLNQLDFENFSGYLVIEFEVKGDADPVDGIRRSANYLRLCPSKR